jgi:hypothetical protein
LPLTALALGDSQFTPGGRQSKFDANAGPGKHVNKGINAEQVDAPPHKLADAGLRNAEEFRCLNLFQTARRDGLLQVDHQIRTHLQVFGLLG